MSLYPYLHTLTLPYYMHEHAGPPSVPYNLTVVTYNYTTETFTIELTWMHMAQDIYTYKIYVYVSTTYMYYINTTITTHILEGQYNIPINVIVSAINCAGSSEDATQEVFRGISDVATCS